MTSIIFKVLRLDEWREFEKRGAFYGTLEDQSHGFIHLSAVNQLHETIAKHFSGEDNLGLLIIDSKKLGDKLKWEPSRNNELFPHLYGEIPKSAVITKYAPPLDAETIQKISESFKSIG